MTDEQTPPGEAAATLTAGMLQTYQTLGPYTTLQEAVARLSRNPVGVVMDEAGHPLTVVTRETLLTLLGGGKEGDHARGKMGARQQARERREGSNNTRSLVSLRDELPPLVSAEVGAPLADLAAQVRAGGAVGVLGTGGVLLSRSLLRRVPAPDAAPDPVPDDTTGNPTAPPPA